MMRQSAAIILDAYRDLQSRKLFWAVLILNAVGIGVFSLLGTNDHTLTVLWFEPLGDMSATGLGSPQLLYKFLFSYLVVGFWLTWLATLLALISTAGIFPDFLSSGSVDLYLAKPISRLRLFISKYVSGLLFVTLQVSLFTFASFLVLGIRGHVWQPGLFAAIPLVVLFFSYLYSICVLLGTLTRSTVAALLLTILAWFGIWAVDSVERQILSYRQNNELQQAALDDQIDAQDAKIARLEADPSNAAQITTAKEQRQDLVNTRNRFETSPAVTMTENIAFGIKSLVPKTRETLNLLDRVLFTDKDLQDAARHEDPAATAPRPGFGRPSRGGRRFEAQREAQMALDRKRPVWWIIGTSLVFEAVLLALAAWVFCRRDY